MEAYIEIEYGAEKVEEYVTEILTLGVCSLFFKASFVSKGDKLSAFYDREGYRRLASISRLTTEEAFSIVLAVMKGVHQCEKHCIFAGQFQIDTECMFVDPQCAEVKLIYMPADKEQTLTQKTEGLLLHLREMCSEEANQYIDSALHLIKTEDYGYKALLYQIEKLRREAYLCSVR